MAGFEVIVRPVVFPNIRPAPPRVLAPQDDPTQGLAVISGGGGSLIDLQHSWSYSLTRQKPQKEIKRQYDVDRIYQVEEDGRINKQNYIDAERAKKSKRTNDGSSPGEKSTGYGDIRVIYLDPPTPKPDNIETLKTDQTRDISDDTGNEGGLGDS